MLHMIMNVASGAVTIYQFMIIIYILSSWLPNIRESKFIQFVASWVEPYLSIFRKFIPPFGMIDISTIFAILAFGYISNFALSGLHYVLKTIGL